MQSERGAYALAALLVIAGFAVLFGYLGVVRPEMVAVAEQSAKEAAESEAAYRESMRGISEVQNLVIDGKGLIQTIVLDGKTFDASKFIITIAEEESEKNTEVVTVRYEFSKGLNPELIVYYVGGYNKFIKDFK